MEKVWANKLSNQKEFDKIIHFLFGVGVPNPDQSGCCSAQVTDRSWANREGLAKKANPEKKKWRPQPDSLRLRLGQVHTITLFY